ncbi:hypothetical protein VTN00DRAFT_769 [Thermoascus crustaceus]|uniref:uncharacterized protein n=1 Tax=Thermoascus crustaceus TaxID=5088 RepID=UPI0037426D04
MLNISVAMESKKISEASKRDSSTLKSLTVLTALFFPATFIAALFALPNFTSTPFWLYWVITIPLTLVTFGSLAMWTLHRQRWIAKETTRMDPGLYSDSSDGNTHGGAERDLENGDHTAAALTITASPGKVAIGS